MADVDKKPAKRGSKSASIEHTSTATKAEISKIISDNTRWLNYEIPKTDEEFAERLNEFFVTCNETNSYPTVEKMSLALGTVRQTLWRWEQGDGATSARSDMIKKAKQILAGIDADLVQSGKIPQITYIFRAKNFFDMADKTEVQLSANQPLGQELPREEIINALPQIEDNSDD